MNDYLEQTYWITLAHLPRWGAEKINKLIIKNHLRNLDLEKFFDLDEKEWISEYELNSSDINDLIDAKKNLANNSFLAESLLSQGFEVIPITSKDYPQTLKNNLKTKFSPPVIYTKGNKQIFEEDSIAIVGSRDASETSLKFTDNIAKLASKNFKVVVSGFAKGVDQQALESAIKYLGRSIIVLPQGILTFTSGMNKYYKQIVDGNVVVLSTFHPKSVWSAGLAMARNPIIYGLAKDIYVAQSSDKGGTWEGVKKGLKMGREIYVRMPEVSEENANLELIRLGSIPIDFDGKEIRPYSEGRIVKDTVKEPLVVDNEIGVTEIIELLTKADHPLSAKEISKSLNGKIKSQKISHLLKDASKISKSKGKSIKYSCHKVEGSLFSNVEEDKIPEMQLINSSDNIIRNAVLELIKVDFVNFDYWMVIYESNKVNARITDNDFIQKVNSSRFGFAKGDELIADIKLVENLSKKEIEITNVIECKLKFKE